MGTCTMQMQKNGSEHLVKCVLTAVEANSISASFWWTLWYRYF